MSEQPSTSAATAAAAPTMSGLMEEELSLVKCMNQKEAIEYEIQLKKLITNVIKGFNEARIWKKVTWLLAWFIQLWCMT